MADSGIDDLDNIDRKPANMMAANSFSADNECAQALLALAQSSGPDLKIKCEDGPSDIEGQLSSDSQYSTNYLDSSSSDRSVGLNEMGTRRSILKHHLESNPKGVRKKEPQRHDTKQFSAMAAVCAEEYRLELVKRIKLDHNYSSSTNDRPISNDNLLYGNGNSEMSVNYNMCRNNTDDFKLDPKIPHNSPKSGKRTHSDRNNRSSKSSRNKEALLSLSQSYYDDGPGKGGTMMTSNLHAVKSEKENFGNSVNVPMMNNLDLYQPDDSKYKNFNLLLKCLTTDDALDEKTSSSRERCDSNVNDVSFSSEESAMITEPSNTVDDPNDYQCKCCLKVFQKKRYLTKHIRRMHPDKQHGESEKDDFVACPNCSHSVPRKHFKKHSTVCNAHTKKSKKQLEMDLANCQFCGIRMRRHILVKHLAQEHCVENCRDFPGFVEDMESDSDESTISGSEHDVDDVELASPTKEFADMESAGGLSSRSSEHGMKQSSYRNGQSQKSLVSCQLCNVELTEDKLSKHLADEHCVEPQPETKEPCKVMPGSTEKTSEKCTHSMLQRFLSDSSDGGEPEATTNMKSSEECKSCVERLVSQQSEESTKKALTCTASASYTIFMGQNQYQDDSRTATVTSTLPQSNSQTV